MAAYCRALAEVPNLENLENLLDLDNLESLESLEHLAQEVLGASLRYRAVLDRLLAAAPAGSNEDTIGRRRLASLRSLLHFTSLRYNALAGLHRRHL